MPKLSTEFQSNTEDQIIDICQDLKKLIYVLVKTIFLIYRCLSYLQSFTLTMKIGLLMSVNFLKIFTYIFGNKK